MKVQLVITPIELVPYFVNEYKIQKSEHVLAAKSVIEIKDNNGVYSIINRHSRIHKTLTLPPENRLKYIDFETMVAIAKQLISNNILFIHASAVILNGKGYIFMGDSGMGKSTIISHVKDGIYADDTVLIKKVGRRFFIYPSIFDKRFVHPKLSKPFPVEHIFVLNKSDTNTVTEIPYRQKFTALISNDIYLSCRDTLPKKFYSLVFDAINLIKIQKLSFTKHFNPSRNL